MPVQKFNKMVKRLSWKDMQLIKASVFLITLPIGACLYQYILPYWWVFIVLGIMAAIKPIKTTVS